MFRIGKANAGNNLTAMIKVILGDRDGKSVVTTMPNCLTGSDRDLSFSSSSWPGQRSHIGRDIITCIKGHTNEYKACNRAVRT